MSSWPTQLSINARSCVDQRALLARVHRLEGQIHGVRRMIEQERPAGDVVVELQAVEGAARGLSLALVDAHVRFCFHQEQTQDERETLIQELIQVHRSFRLAEASAPRLDT